MTMPRPVPDDDRATIAALRDPDARFVAREIESQYVNREWEVSDYLGSHDFRISYATPATVEQIVATLNAHMPDPTPEVTP